jgi:hypothetical protein
MREKINKAFSFDESKPESKIPEQVKEKPVEQKPIEEKPIVEEKPPEEPKPVEPKSVKPSPKPKDDEDSTDKYIALLQKGLIGKEEFVALMGINKNKNHSMLY